MYNTVSCIGTVPCIEVTVTIEVTIAIKMRIQWDKANKIERINNAIKIQRIKNGITINFHRLLTDTRMQKRKIASRTERAGKVKGELLFREKNS